MDELKEFEELKKEFEELMAKLEDTENKLEYLIIKEKLWDLIQQKIIEAKIEECEDGKKSFTIFLNKYFVDRIVELRIQLEEIK